MVFLLGIVLSRGISILWVSVLILFVVVVVLRRRLCGIFCATARSFPLIGLSIWVVIFLSPGSYRIFLLGVC